MRSLSRFRVIHFGLALLFSAAGAGVCHADCAALYALAQQHAYDMARRNSLDHAGFKRHRGPAGAVAENVAVGCETEDCARRDGLLMCPEGGATLAAYRNAMTEGLIDAGDEVVLFNCATGLKYPMPDASRTLDKDAPGDLSLL